MGEYGDTFLLQMSYGVGAAKMSAALGDALKPRCGDAALVSEFEECLTKGLPNGAPKVGWAVCVGGGGGVRRERGAQGGLGSVCVGEGGGLGYDWAVPVVARSWWVDNVCVFWGGGGAGRDGRRARS